MIKDYKKKEVQISIVNKNIKIYINNNNNQAYIYNDTSSTTRRENMFSSKQGIFIIYKK